MCKARRAADENSISASGNNAGAERMERKTFEHTHMDELDTCNVGDNDKVGDGQ